VEGSESGPGYSLKDPRSLRKEFGDKMKRDVRRDPSLDLPA